MLEQVHHFEHAGIAGLARRLAGELRRPDSVSDLAIEALSLEMLVAARRERGSPSPGRRPPKWLLRAQEYLHAHFRDPVSAVELARQAGVHPVHLSRVFRACFRSSIGDYVRALRLDWAARALVESDAPLSDIALDAGFADQSHLTRAFKGHTGMTPGRYRETMGGRRA